MDDLQMQFKQQINEYLESIKDDIKNILHEAIMDTVFSYNPSEYRRTGQLEDIDNIDVKFDNDGSLIVYINTDNLQYYSFGKGEGYDNSGLKQINGDCLTHFLEVGHDSYSPYEGDADMFWHYPARRFLEVAQERVQEKYPDLIVTVIREQPDIC